METLRTKRLCPKCNKGVLDKRTPRGLLVRTAFFWLPIRRFKCSSCDRKTYVFGSHREASEAGTANR